ncbi:MAG: hypothetical protein E7055_18885 [Lentisphaerae bacterium]|nr:hypothetical protein [Lentisphaerota bacterium]
MNKQNNPVEPTSEQEQKITENTSSPLIAFLKYIESFLGNVIWGILIKCLFIRIPKFIFEMCKKFLTFIFNILKDFVTWFFRNFRKIIEVIYRIIKISLLLIVLAAIIMWPVLFHPLLLAAWIFLVVLPGTIWGIIRWRRQQKNQQDKNESPDQVEDSKLDDTMKELPSPSEQDQKN